MTDIKNSNEYFVPQVIQFHVEYLGARIPVADPSNDLVGFMPVFSSREAAEKHYPDGQIAVIEVEDSSLPGGD